ncbi:MAG: hypothetical protein QXP22_02805 [Candidatus Anstonellales archaeon]
MAENEKKHFPYEIIGDIAIIEIDKKHGEKIGKQALEFANQLLTMPYIKSVFIKSSAVSGSFRTRKLIFLVGINKSETIHKEHGIKLMLDINKVYFSPRLSEERKRIAMQVKNNENIAVLFGGIAPYALVIWKYNKDKNINIMTMELNRDACYYAKKNIEINKAQDKIKAICDDVKNIYEYKNYESWADRIIAPLPKDVISFFDEIKYVAKDHAICHIYVFAKDEKEAIEKTKALGNIIFAKQCGSYSKDISRFVVDIEIKKS